jgi:hypothetical protein
MSYIEFGLWTKKFKGNIFCVIVSKNIDMESIVKNYSIIKVKSILVIF